MLDARRILGAVLAAPSLLALAGVATSHRAPRTASGIEAITPAARHAGLRFEPTVAAGDREAVAAAIAAARPEARALIDVVDGLVDVSVGSTGTRAIGLTEAQEARYRVTLDLGLVSTRYGERGIERLVLHELGHVLDHALLPDALIASLDAGIPSGWGCEQGTMGACADREERFAETFAKWALGDIGVNLNIGYKVPPPALPLDTWGSPLAKLSASG
jgi:hypothetical protein